MHETHWQHAVAKIFFLGTRKVRVPQIAVKSNPMFLGNWPGIENCRATANCALLALLGVLPYFHPIPLYTLPYPRIL